MTFLPNGPHSLAHVISGHGDVVGGTVVGGAGSSTHSHDGQPSIILRPDDPHALEHVIVGQGYVVLGGMVVGGVVVGSSTHSHVSHPLTTLRPDEPQVFEQVTGAHCTAGVVGTLVVGDSRSDGPSKKNKKKFIEKVVYLYSSFEIKKKYI